MPGFESGTSSSRTKHSTRLSYTPTAHRIPPAFRMTEDHSSPGGDLFVLEVQRGYDRPGGLGPPRESHLRYSCEPGKCACDGGAVVASGQRLKAINAGDQKIRCGRCESTDLPSLRDCHPLCLECISSLRLEGAVEWRLAAPAVSEAGGSPDCWGLLRDPATVLTDRATRPEHLCFQLLMDSTERWANRTVPRSEARWHEQGCDCLTCQMSAPQALMRSGSRRALRYLRPWPLPVGKEVLAKAWSLGPFGLMEGRELYEVDWAPFEHDERAAIILDLSLEGVRVEAFGLVSLQRGRSDISGQFWEPTRPSGEALRQSSLRRSCWTRRPKGALVRQQMSALSLPTFGSESLATPST